MPTRRIIVDGRVQGVGFRHYARHEARRLGICGEVWNRLDGKVECIAQTEDSAALEQFQEALRLGPGRIDDVLAHDIVIGRKFEDFEVGITRP